MSINSSKFYISDGYETVLSRLGEIYNTISPKWGIGTALAEVVLRKIGTLLTTETMLVLHRIRSWYKTE